MTKARIYRAYQNEFLCKNEKGEIFSTKAKGNLLKGKNNIVVGDNVLLDEKNHIVELLERSNEIFRILPRESKKKVVASNCDFMVIMASVSRPLYKRGLVDRYLVRSFQWGIRPLLVFNKMDQYEPNALDLSFEVERLGDLGVSCFEVASKFPEYEKKYLDWGIDDLLNTIKGKTSIFLGQSGVGKSKTITRLSNGKVTLKTQEIGKTGKGSHTTTWSELIDCDAFSLIDSPGIRSFSLDDIKEEELAQFFPDLEPYFSQCQFSNCSHESHIKGCYFWKNNSNDKEHLFRLSRLESYCRILEEISANPEWQKKY